MTPGTIGLAFFDTNTYLSDIKMFKTLKINEYRHTNTGDDSDSIKTFTFKILCQVSEILKQLFHIKLKHFF